MENKSYQMKQVKMPEQYDEKRFKEKLAEYTKKAEATNIKCSKCGKASGVPYENADKKLRCITLHKIEMHGMKAYFCEECLNS